MKLWALALLQIAFATCALVGIAWKGWSRISGLFLPFYLLRVVVERLCMMLWPERFYTRGFWLITEVVCAALALGMALEMLLLVFGRLPVGRVRSMRMAAVLLIAAYVVM